jgi:hypothetical protein
MESTDLFSHPTKPEHVEKTDDSEAPVQAPTFSDQPKKSSSPLAQSS